MLQSSSIIASAFDHAQMQESSTYCSFTAEIQETLVLGLQGLNAFVLKIVYVPMGSLLEMRGFL